MMITQVKTWQALCEWLGVLGEQDSTPLAHLTRDSRLCQQGDVFIALAGVHQHGAHYAQQARALGAWVIADVMSEGVHLCVPDLADRMGALLNWFYDNPSQSMRLVGITGTNGKTSVSHYVAQWLHQLGESVAVLGTVGNGRWGQLQSSSHTTQDAPLLYRQLAQWRDEGVRIVVMEVSSHAIHQNRIAGLSFAVVALTQVTRDHLDYHGSLEAYRAEKARLFTDWPAQVAVLNLDDSLGAKLALSIPSPLTYALKAKAGLMANSVVCVSEGLRVDLALNNVAWQGVLPLYGIFNVENILCALGCMQGLGIPLASVIKLLPTTQPVAGRMQWVRQQPRVLVDYAHTPDALEKALLALRTHVQQGRVWVVFGAGGDRDQGKRPLMGAVANRYADVLIVTDDNPRSEVPADIAAAILQACDKDKATYIADRAAAICRAIFNAKDNDVVLIAGKGHEDYQEIAGVRHPFSDREVIQQCSA
ncbi:MAG TPA: UDP-N-acetylmuramoyl-L-alanyl-D-glutamate--2,6-diaminopimelate ligase [Thiotrichales bacterium]|nr:UDP-N-acetylmuramoyl-L-alanyl-D-glutamate--2,6-diaminopimelate ligase [Thiotrichales bacterium]